MKIQVLGPGCTRCTKLYENVRAAVDELTLDCDVEKISDMRQILAYNVISTPVLVIDGQVKASGRVLSPSEIKPLLV
jgi:small redox-active disulfide protein 2